MKTFVYVKKIMSIRIAENKAMSLLILIIGILANSVFAPRGIWFYLGNVFFIFASLLAFFAIASNNKKASSAESVVKKRHSARINICDDEHKT
jgi:heme/copper-type cytochrome/quinol oxidase subunit 3